MKKDLDSTHIMQNGTGYQLRDALDSIAKSLKILAVTESANVDLTNYRHIQNIVQLGKAKEYFQIGDQIHTTWSPDGETEYDMPWDVVDFGPVTDPDGVVHENAMWLESHYALPELQFDFYEAFYVAPEAMPAGTYHFMFGTKIWSSTPVNTPFMFTLTKAVPAGGMLILGVQNADVVPMSGGVSDWRIRVYTNGAQANPEEIVEVSQGDEGTNLGSLVHDTPFSTSGLNDVFRLFGYNRWSQSALRQWLNSGKAIGEWWKQQNPYDLRTSYLMNKRGFIAGLQSNFLTIVKPVKVITALNHSTDKEFGESETTIDRFFPASLEQEYIEPQWHGEGTAFKYWVDRLGMEQKRGSIGTRTDHIRYFLANTAITAGVRLRSPNISSSEKAHIVSGYGTSQAAYSCLIHGSCPCCVIY